jgi:threonylcarbamoyladenosine tRNA methylthiotransferase MtaB
LTTRPTASFTTLGCKVNQYETQAILASFERAGFLVVPPDCSCDVAVINTCSVTSDAEAKSRMAVRKAKRLSPSAAVIATGCAAQMAVNKGCRMDSADLIVPNPDKLAVIDYLRRARPDLLDLASSAGPLAFAEPKGRTRAALKVQDGCSVMCSYCSIPFTRPVMTSRPWEDVLSEARMLASQGFHEAVLTGVLIGAYGPETGSAGPCFEDLVEILARDSGLRQLRISSIELHQVTERLMDLIVQGAVVPHLHIPLQSGDDHVLADMNRRYRQADFLRVIRRLRERAPGISITTDIMVGFPTETEEGFQSTIHVCREAQFLRAHVFRFSPRWGTPADKWGDPVQPQEKQRRAQVLAKESEEIGAFVRREWLARTVEVIVERRPNRQGLLEGTSPNWLNAVFVGPESMCATIQRVRLDELDGDKFLGEVSHEPLIG